MSRHLILFSLSVAMCLLNFSQHIYSQAIKSIEKDGVIYELWKNQDKLTVLENEIVVWYKKGSSISKIISYEEKIGFVSIYRSKFDKKSKEIIRDQESNYYNLRDLREIDDMIKSDSDDVVEFISPVFSHQNTDSFNFSITNILLIIFKPSTSDDAIYSLLDKYKLSYSDMMMGIYIVRTSYKDYKNNIKIVEGIEKEKIVDEVSNNLLSGNIYLYNSDDPSLGDSSNAVHNGAWWIYPIGLQLAWDITLGL